MQSYDEAGAKVTVDRSWNTEVEPNIWDPPTLPFSYDHVTSYWCPLTVRVKE